MKIFICVLLSIFVVIDSIPAPKAKVQKKPVKTLFMPYVVSIMHYTNQVEQIIPGVLIGNEFALTIGHEVGCIQEVENNNTHISVFDAWVVLGIGTPKSMQIRVIDKHVLKRNEETILGTGDLALFTFWDPRRPNHFKPIAYSQQDCDVTGEAYYGVNKLSSSEGAILRGKVIQRVFQIFGHKDCITTHKIKIENTQFCGIQKNSKTGKIPLYEKGAGLIQGKTLIGVVANFIKVKKNGIPSNYVVFENVGSHTAFIKLSMTLGFRKGRKIAKEHIATNKSPYETSIDRPLIKPAKSC